MSSQCQKHFRDSQPILGPLQTQDAVTLIKDVFQKHLAKGLNLRRIAAPLVLPSGRGINDDLNGVERPVSFSVPGLNGARVEVPQSLAKWKRLALWNLAIPPGSGILTDMQAIRPDESLDELHSIHVDQWDWERTILPEERSLSFLQYVVRGIYSAIRSTEGALARAFPVLEARLPDEITFLHADDLAREHPEMPPRCREELAARRHGAIFLAGIGAPLCDGRPHDGRSPDYDDWITPNGRSRGLNGDILVWHEPLQRAVELSSMGIRVTASSLLEQLALRGCPERKNQFFHRRLLAGELPFCVGGGIGQSRLCMVLLRKLHIGEVQVSVWPAAMRRENAAAGVFLL